MNAVGHAAGVTATVVANAVLSSSTDPFIEAVKGRVPLAKSVSAARTWSTTGDSTTGAYVPRPDRSLNALQWFSTLGGVLGMDHFYLRSPTTGFFKLLIGCLVISYFALPSVFGFNTIVAIVLLLWVIWDVLQVWCEPSRIVNYGMSLPFDLGTGIGQGMVTDQGSSYKQNSNFIVWGLTLIVGFLGIDSLMVGKPGVMLRKWFDTLLLYFTGKAVIDGMYWWLLMVVPLVAFLIIPWLINMYWFVFSPAEMFEKGIQLPDTLRSFFNYFTAWFPEGQKEGDGSLSPEEEDKQKLQEAVVSDFGYGSISAKEMKQKFSVLFPGEGDDEESSSSIGRTWPVSMVFASVYTAPVAGLILWIYQFWNPTAKVLNMYPIKDHSSLLSRLPGASVFGPAMNAASDAVRSATGSADGLQSALGSMFEPQRGGARKEPLSTEAKILGASIIAIITGGGLKGLVDYLIKE
jgi:hypothetical protein